MLDIVRCIRKEEFHRFVPLNRISFELLKTKMLTMNSIWSTSTMKISLTNRNLVDENFSTVRRCEKRETWSDRDSNERKSSIFFINVKLDRGGAGLRHRGNDRLSTSSLIVNLLENRWFDVSRENLVHQLNRNDDRCSNSRNLLILFWL